MIGPPRVRRRLVALASAQPNFDPRELSGSGTAEGWRVDDICEVLLAEPPGDPVPGGTWQLAQALMRGYAFADPSIVRGFYDPDAPLQGRNMLLKLQAFGLVHLYVGVRVNEVYDTTRIQDGREARVWGWNYRTLKGHVEAGQMDWEVWKWPDTGAVEFRVHAVSRRVAIANPFVRVGYALSRGHERALFLASTGRRMRAFTDLAAGNDDGPAAVRAAARAMSARRSPEVDVTAEELEHALREVCTLRT